MANITPFPAIRPPAEKAAAISSPPYDVMSRSEAKEMAAENPLSFLLVTRSEIDLPRNCDPYSREVYNKARENYDALKKNAPLIRDDTPAYYIYTLEANDHRQTGIAATVAVQDYRDNVVLKHEKTRQQKEDDRTNHILATGAQTGPVFLTYRDRSAIDRIVSKTIDSTSPIADFKACDGVRNTIWKVPATDTSELHKEFIELPALYIADGHHRAASAARVATQIANQKGELEPDDPAENFLAIIFPSSQLRVLPYNRVVKDLNGLTSDFFLKKLQEAGFVVEKTSAKQPAQPRRICMYLKNQWYMMRYKGDLRGCSPAQALDVAILQREVLEPILSISDPRVDERIDFVGGIRGPEALEKRVDTGAAKVAFSMYPTTVQQLMDVSDAGEMMPPKSTWFEPKLRDGLLIHEIAD